jgi:hypothetical protein
MQLNDLRSLNLDSIQDLLCIVAAGHPMQVMGEDMQFLSQAFQARAIYHLLLDFDTSAFALNLQRGAHARRYFLRKSREQGSNDAIFGALSRTDAVFDCIVGGDLPLAVEIRNLSPQEWTPAGEYLEDFCYHGLLYAYIAGAADQALNWRDHLEAAVSGIPSPGVDAARLDVCTAFLSGDQSSFWAAFERLVEISGEAAASVPLADPRVFEYPWLGAERYISIELVAWMSLARRLGFQPPQREYLRCPSAAWTDGQIAPPPEIFVAMEAQFGL